MQHLMTFEKFYFEPLWRLKDLLRKTEAYFLNPDMRKEFEKIKVELEKNSPEFVNLMKESNTNLLFRGSEQVIDKILVKNVRKDRIAKDTDALVQDLLDRKMKEKLGVKLRSEGVFATKSLNIATHYGTPYIFFPIGDLRYFWNPAVDDLYLEFDSHDLYDFYRTDDEGYLEIIFKEEFPGDISVETASIEKIKRLTELAHSLFEKEIDEYVDGYIDRSLELSNKQEITFICDRYYLISTDYIHFFYEWFDIIPKMD